MRKHEVEGPRAAAPAGKERREKQPDGPVASIREAKRPFRRFAGRGREKNIKLVIV